MGVFVTPDGTGVNKIIEGIHICDAWLPPGMPHCADDAENARADAGECDGATSGQPESLG